MEMSKELKFEIWRDFGQDDEFSELVYEIIRRMDNNSEDDLLDAIDDVCIYYCNMWTVLKHYYNPNDKNMNWDNAIEIFLADMQCVLAYIKR